MKDPKAPCTILKDLISALDSFRSSNHFSARIPHPLRESILKAIDDGIGAKDVRKFLKIGDAQIRAPRQLWTFDNNSDEFSVGTKNFIDPSDRHSNAF
jgi:hypothetical protein